MEFRDMVPSDIEAGLRMCRVSNWNQVRRDWEMFLRLSPRGCRVAVRDGQVIGTVATINYDGRFAWIAMVLVDPAARGSGIGTKLVREALAAVADVPCIRLDATPAGQGVYRQLGFVDEYALGRMAAPIATTQAARRDPATRPMTRSDLNTVLEIDADVFGADRRTLFEWQLEGAPEYAWVHEAGGRITGFMLGRHGFLAEHLGPVIAHDEDAARKLVAACLHHQTGKPVVIDATQHSAEWRPWLGSLGFRELRPFMRMYRGSAPATGVPARQYAIVGPEFG